MGISRVGVIGAGLSGLMLAWKLQEAGLQTILLEAKSEVGGVAKTAVWHGFRLETGPHSLYTEEQPLAQELKDLMGREYLIPTRQNRVWYENRWITYPLSTRSLLEIPATTLFQAVGELGLLWVQKRLVPNLPKSAAQLSGFLPEYGHVLDKLLMGEYVQKVRQVPASSLRPSWFTSSPPESTIDSIRQLIRGLFRAPQGRSLTFHDPAQGFGSIAKKLAQRIQSAGGTIVTNASLHKVYAPNDEVKAIAYRKNDQEFWIPLDYVFSTIPLTTLFFRWDPLPPHTLLEHTYRLRHCSLVHLHILLDVVPEESLWWGYFPEPRYSFYRVSPAMLHRPSHQESQQKSCLTVEWMLPIDHPLHTATADQLLQEALPGLEQAQLVRASSIRDVRVDREVGILPLEHPDQELPLRAISTYLTKVRRFRALGQQANFEPNSLTHTLQSSLQAAQTLIAEAYSGKYLH